MRALLIVTYLVKLALYVPRMALFRFYRLLVFLTKPGAVFILPLALMGVTFWYREMINLSFWAHELNAQFYGWLTHTLYELTGTVQSIRNLSPAMTALAVEALAIPVLYVIFLILRPVIGTLPVIAPPLFPQLWLPPREVKLKPYRATIAVPMLSPRAWDGNMRDLVERLPDDVRAVLEHRPEPPRAIPAPVIDMQPKPVMPEAALHKQTGVNVFADDDIVRPQLKPFASPSS